jgi:hypothetical protein
MWTKDWLKRKSVLGNLIKEVGLSSPLEYKNYLRMGPSTFGELLELITPLVQREDTNLTVAQQDSKLFKNRQTVAQTVKPHHTLSNSLRNSLCCANCLTVCGALYASGG